MQESARRDTLIAAPGALIDGDTSRERTMPTPKTEKRLLAIYAHPDDEAFGSGGTLAKYASEGCRVHLVTATRGEAGGISEGMAATKANLPDVREEELRCACQVYDIQPPVFLDYLDGQLTIVHQGQAVGKLVRIIRDIRPQVVITFGPDGIYGHYDHIAVHRWATIAVQLAADPACFPEIPGQPCDPHRVSKLYYRALTQAQLAEMGQNDRPAVMMDGVPFPFVARSDREIAAVLDVGAYVKQKLQGILCHRSQLAPDHPYLVDPDAALGSPGFAQEAYVLAESTVGRSSSSEDDLFRGLD
jgi:LmbE family N-acetylglucosaminyl deacetylase